MNSKGKIQKIGSNASHRKSMISNMSTSLILHEYMETTRAKAKAVIPFMERLISVAKAGDMHSKRRALSLLKNEKATDKIFNVLVPRFKDIKGGYISTYKLGRRKGDNSEVVKLVLRGYELPKKKSRIKETRKVEKVADQTKTEQSDAGKKESKGLFGGRFPKFGKSKEIKGNQNTAEDKSKAKSRSGI